MRLRELSIDDIESLAVGAWVLGSLAELSDLQTVFVVATSLYLIGFLAMVPRFKALAQNMETPPVEEARDGVRRTAE